MIGFARDLKRLSRLVIQNGLRHAVGMGLYSIRARLMRFFDRAWEKTEGLSFNHKHVPLATLTVQSPNKRHGFSYVPCTAIAVRALLANIPTDFSDFCFIDFGSGEGRSLVVASTYPFAEIIGVEFAMELHDTATQNLRKANPTAAQSGKYRSIHMDATQFEIPRRKCVLYFYNPFEAAVMRQVLLNIEQAYRECGAEMFIVFHQTRAALETNDTNNALLFRAADFLTECPIRIPSMLTRFLMGSQDYYLFKTITPTPGVSSLEFFDQRAPSLIEAWITERNEDNRMSSVLEHELDVSPSGDDTAYAAREQEVRVAISAVKTKRILLCIVATLVITGTTAGFVSKYVSPSPQHKLTKLMNRFDINHEPSIPAWYSSSALLVSSALLLLTGIARMQERDRFYMHWLALGGVFLWLSLDEAAMFHEGINTALVVSQPETEGVFYFPWVIPALIFVAIVGICYVRFLRHIDRRTAAFFLVAGAVYVMGAVGMEMSAGPFVEMYGELSLPHMICEVIEETLEMLGIVIFIYALLDHLARCVPPIRLQFV